MDATSAFSPPHRRKTRDYPPRRDCVLPAKSCHHAESRFVSQMSISEMQISIKKTSLGDFSCPSGITKIARFRGFRQSYLAFCCSQILNRDVLPEPRERNLARALAPVNYARAIAPSRVYLPIQSSSGVINNICCGKYVFIYFIRMQSSLFQVVNYIYFVNIDLRLYMFV